MARAATTFDTFNAVAEPQRRQILTLLAKGECSVNGVAGSLHFTQPQTSKHLRVLRHVGLVTVRGAGQQRLYKLNGKALKPIHDWTQSFEAFWNDRLDRLDDYLKVMQAQETQTEQPDDHP